MRVDELAPPVVVDCLRPIGVLRVSRGVRADRAVALPLAGRRPNIASSAGTWETGSRQQRSSSVVSARTSGSGQRSSSDHSGVPAG